MKIFLKSVFIAVLIISACTPSSSPTPSSSNNPIVPSTGIVTDIDGNSYITVTIGTQIWIAENLRTTRYCNGDSIPNLTDSLSWNSSTIGAWCWNMNVSNFESVYGKLYNWFAVSDSRNLCPCGWHVPSDAEWSELIRFIDANSNMDTLGSLAAESYIAGGKMKAISTLWLNNDGTNETGFSALPGGSRDINYNFTSPYWSAVFWSSSIYNANESLTRIILNSNNINREKSKTNNGFSIRCIKD